MNEMQLVVNAIYEESALPARVLAMCNQRGWDLHWTSRGAYLHLESSELIEALRGKRGNPLSEAADVLLVLMSITENAGILWDDVLMQTAATCARLEMCDPYLGEEAPHATASAQPAAIAQPAEVDQLTPKEIEAQECFTALRDEILSLNDGLEVNEVLRIIDNHTPEWV
jgi:NTP pyrophosphatase (non-canonical NTP hydrolase)